MRLSGLTCASIILHSFAPIVRIRPGACTCAISRYVWPVNRYIHCISHITMTFTYLRDRHTATQQVSVQPMLCAHLQYLHPSSHVLQVLEACFNQMPTTQGTYGLQNRRGTYATQLGNLKYEAPKTRASVQTIVPIILLHTGCSPNHT